MLVGRGERSDSYHMELLTLVKHSQSNKELRYLLPLKEEYLLFVRSLAFFADGE